MAGLTSLLNTARDALSAQSFGLNVAGQNVANANTPLYVRREAIIQNQAIGTQSTGSVVATGIRRAVDAYADRRFFEANANSNAATQYDSELQQIESLFNDLAATGLGNSLDAVFKSFQQLGALPADATVRADVLNKLDMFASTARSVGDNLAQQRGDMWTRARETASQTNEQSAEIAQLNARIVQARMSGHDAADLIDLRNSKLLNLSGLIDVKAIEGQDGSIFVQSAGIMLVEGSHSRALSVGLDEQNKLQIFASRMGGSQPDTEITASLSGGKLAGIKEARDEDLFDVSARFDRFIFDVAGSINSQHALGFGLDRSTGVNVFDVGPTSDGAARGLRLTSALAGHPEALAAAGSVLDLPGGSDNAVRLGKLAEVTNVFGSRTPSQAYGDIVGTIGVSRASSRAEVELRENVFQQTQTARESTSGVSLDEEMVNLQRFQRAYEAAGKVITIVDELLEELMARVGR